MEESCLVYVSCESLKFEHILCRLFFYGCSVDFTTNGKRQAHSRSKTFTIYFSLSTCSDPTLVELKSAQGEISEYYWRQLRYGAQSHSYLYEEISKDDEPAPAPAPAHPALPSVVECTSNPYCGGKEKSVQVEFQYNVECSGYVSGYEFDKMDYAILEETASGHCDNGDYEWLQRRDLSAKKENIKVEAGPNSVLDILGDEVEDALQKSPKNNKNSRRKLEIISIDADPDDKLSGNGHCTPQNDIAKAANCCQQRTGYVTVTYNECNDNSNKKDIEANVLSKIQDVMDNSNKNIFDNDKGNVVELVYVGPKIPSVIASSQEMVFAAPEKVSAGALAGIILALLALLALLAMLVSRRRRRTDAKDRTIATDKLDGESYIAADYGNLGGRHSKLDVHQCKSSLCKECPNGNGRHMTCHHVGSQECLPMVDEESPEIVKQLAAIRDRDVVFLRTQGTARGQTTEHVNIDLGSSSSASTASSSPPSTPPRSPSRNEAEGPTFTDQEEITASLDINRVGSSARSRVI